VREEGNTEHMTLYNPRKYKTRTEEDAGERRRTRKGGMVQRHGKGVAAYGRESRHPRANDNVINILRHLVFIVPATSSITIGLGLGLHPWAPSLHYTCTIVHYKRVRVRVASLGTHLVFITPTTSSITRGGGNHYTCTIKHNTREWNALSTCSVLVQLNKRRGSVHTCSVVKANIAGEGRRDDNVPVSDQSASGRFRGILAWCWWDGPVGRNEVQGHEDLMGWATHFEKGRSVRAGVAVAGRGGSKGCKIPRGVVVSLEERKRTTKPLE
jgi:hypothetical protein